MLDVKDLRKQFGKITAVDGVSFGLNEGETIGLLGPNGSGKSTILRCVAGLMFPTSGAITIAGLDPRTSAARHSFSYLPQRVAFPENLTAREVAEFFCRLRKLPLDRASQALTDASIPADRMVREFSGGMVQRLGIAIAMLPDAPLLILDEPTASLDPEGAIQFRNHLANLKQRGKTIIFTSHVLSDVEALADRVAVLVGGRLAAIEHIDVLRRLAHRLSLEEVYLRYVREMHLGDRFFVVDDGLRERAAGTR